MGTNTNIEWCDHTFNPWRGCQAVSPACDHCYAQELVERYDGKGSFAERRRTSIANWKLPIRWNREAQATGVRERVFAASLADVFDNKVPAEWRHDLWELIAATPHLDWLLLTKRPQNIAKMLPSAWGKGWLNVWLGTTCENQEEADRRIPHLLVTPAQVHFLSCEPLLGLINLSAWMGVHHHPDNDRSNPRLTELVRAAFCMMTPSKTIDWIIAGGESGRNARPMHPDWARGLRDQCAAAEVSFFMKQMGGAVKSRMAEIPTELLVREFPNVTW